MANDSASGGYLQSVAPSPVEDADLDDVFTTAIAALSGLLPANVWPKWQASEPSQPDRSVTWCAFGVTVTDADLNPSVEHDGSADRGRGLSTETRTEYLDLLASFHGPACRSAASALRDNIRVGQNRETLKAQGVAYNAFERLTAVPELQNQGFVRRTDLVLKFSRRVSRTFAIRNVSALAGGLFIDGQSVTGPATLADPLQTGT